MALTQVNHPIAQHWLSRIRRTEASPSVFREGARIVSTMVLYEATRHWPSRLAEFETPLGPTQKPELDGPAPVGVPILRAGLSMVPGFLGLFPDGHIGMLGMQRNEETLQADTYYSKIPQAIHGNRVIVLDPMLATGGSMCAALEKLRQYQPAEIMVVCLLAAPEGVEKVEQNFPGMKIFTAALDEQLNSVGYIVPGLGDAGDRFYNTL